MSDTKAIVCIVASTAVMALAFAVMPNGPWYRQIGAVLIAVLANAIRHGRITP